MIQGFLKNMSLSYLNHQANRPIMRKLDYMALDEGAFEFGWRMEDVYAVEEWWKEGLSVWEMAERLKRDPDELAVLIIDRARKGKIKKRKNGIFG